MVRCIQRQNLRNNKMPEVESLEYDELVDPTTIIIPTEAINSKWLAIDLTILERDSFIGNADYSKLYDRLFCGYWYLLKNQCILDYGLFQFERQRIYEHEFTRIHDALTQANLTQSNYLKAIDGSLNPFDEPTGLYGNGYERYIDGLNTFEGCNRLPAHKLGAVSVWIPVGVMYSIKIQWLDWCDLLSDTDDDGDLDVTPAKGEPILEEINPPLGQNDFESQTFDDVARRAGYILASDCPVSNQFVYAVGTVTGNCSTWIPFQINLGAIPLGVPLPSISVRNNPSTGCVAGQPLAGQGVQMNAIPSLSNAGVGSTWYLVTWQSVPTLQKRNA